MKKINLSKQQKILLVLLKMSKGKKNNLKFEDIAVQLYKTYPKEFHLKGYNDYPDTGDAVKRPLYTFRDVGLLTVNNMIFTLSDKGLSAALKIRDIIKGKKIDSIESLDRYIENEINRILKLKSFQLFINGKKDEIIDSDFFSYLGISVKSSRKDFKSRMSYIENLIKGIQKQKKFISVAKFHMYMNKKFKKEINYKLNN